jgi:HD-GYP domain-containing protein (c-di-GMP phosphodiesterase class II)
MIQATGHPESKAFSGRLRQRLSELGVAVVAISPDGSGELIGPRRWEHELIVSSALFTATIRSRLKDLTDTTGRLTTLWPGLGLVPLHTASGRQTQDNPHNATPVFAAMLLSTDILSAEQLIRVFDAGELDQCAAIARFDTDALLSEQEAVRLARVIAWMARDAGDLGWRLHELHDLSWELAGSYEELSLLYKLSTSMVVDHPPQAFLQQACQEMREVVGLRWLAIQPSISEPGFADLSVPVCVDSRSSFDIEGIREIGPRLAEAMHGRTEPVILDDARVLSIPGLERFAHNLLVTPLHIDGKPLGLLYGADKIDTGSGLSTVDSKLCASLGSSLSIYLKNVLLYADMHSMFIGTLHALSTTIDAKDSYTHGHSERVALISKQLAAAAGLDDETVERVYLSGLVHDVGKIGVPEAVLTKPGRLTKEEYDLVKMHPETGARILEGIRQMDDLIPGVLHHHEAWDGSGYPHGLAGRDIPLFGRILGLADAFDAMSSDRTYRNAMPMHKVLDEVRRCSGQQFDPDLADVFVGLDFGAYLNMIEQHHDRMRTTEANNMKKTD